MGICGFCFSHEHEFFVLLADLKISTGFWLFVVLKLRSGIWRCVAFDFCMQFCNRVYLGAFLWISNVLVDFLSV